MAPTLGLWGGLLNLSDRTRRILQHIPVGVGNIFVFLFNPYAGVLFGVGFLAYQLTQAIHYKFKDKAWQDIAGWLYGLAITGIICYFFI